MAFDANGNWINNASTNLSSMSQWGLNQNSPNNQLGQAAVSGLDFGGSVTGTGGTSPTNSAWFSNAFGGTDAAGNQTSGWVSPTLGAATGLAQSWLGFQNLGVARDQLSFQKSAWQEQFNIQKEEYEYQKQRREERMANYEASLNRSPAASPSNV